MDRIWLVMDCRWKRRQKNESGMIHCFLVGSRWHSLRLAAGLGNSCGQWGLHTHAHVHTHTQVLIESPYQLLEACILSQLNRDGSFIRRLTSPIFQEWKQTQRIEATCPGSHSQLVVDLGLTFILQPQHVLFPLLHPVGPSTGCRGREGRLAKGKDSRKAERVVGVEGGQREQKEKELW